MKKVLSGRQGSIILISAGFIAVFLVAKTFVDTNFLASKDSAGKVPAATTTTSPKTTGLASEATSEHISTSGIIKKDNGEFTLSDSAKTYKLKSNIDLSNFVDKEAKVEGTLTDDSLNVENLEVDGINIQETSDQINIQTQTNNSKDNSNSKIEVKTENNITVNGEKIKVTPTTLNNGSSSQLFIEGSTSGDSGSGDIKIRIRTSQDIDSSSRVRIRTK